MGAVLQQALLWIFW